MFEHFLSIPVFIIAVSLLLVLFTFFRAETIQEKTVAFDVMTLATTSILVFIAFIKNAVFYLDIAIVYALLSFIGVVVVARYQEKGL